MRAMGDVVRRSGSAHRLIPRRAEGASRKTRTSIALAAALAFVPALSPSPSRAASCDTEVVARIRFAPGQACWTYRGPATLFIGKFSSGQTISAQMMGEATDYDPRSGGVATVVAAARSECRGARRLLQWGPGRAWNYHLSRRPRPEPTASVSRPARCGARRAWSRSARAELLARVKRSGAIAGCSATS